MIRAILRWLFHPPSKPEPGSDFNPADYYHDGDDDYGPNSIFGMG